VGYRVQGGYCGRKTPRVRMGSGRSMERGWDGAEKRMDGGWDTGGRLKGLESGGSAKRIRIKGRLTANQMGMMYAKRLKAGGIET
jgi:hypothetical protein